MKGSKYSNVLARRQFLQYAGVATATALVTSGCNKTISYTNPDTIDIGSGDTGVLNFLLALEQFNAAFYSRMALVPYQQISNVESTMYADMRAHDTAHRDVLNNLLGDKAIPTLSIDLAFIDFTSKAKTLAVARQFKDLTIAAYNSAAYAITNTEALSVIIKMASVDARHGAIIQSFVSPNSLANNLDDYGMERPVSIATALQTLNGYLKKRLSADAFGYMPF